MSAHRHNWAPAAPIDPKNDPGNAAARIAHANPKTVTAACDCGAIKMELRTNGRRNLYVTRPTPRGRRLWRGRQ
ncbi:MAG: hypothetical protein A2V88_08730 [Elusimicrobia bacterium RBG_16_66_12]|nr:MAG: hypothetical protein A2V88_08730 [Elusimicrobia bacterium RBG_16_66_12]